MFGGLPAWSVAVPVAAGAMLAVTWGGSPGWLLLSCAVVALIAAVLVAVHHAEVIALRVGEPFGALVLALAVTVIEATLIVAMMLSGGAAASALARDTVFAAVMIICNGVVGLCMVVGGLRHHEQTFRIEGANSSLAALIALATLSLVLPSFTTSSPGATYTAAQLAFAAVASLVLWAVYVFVQTVQHRDYFLPSAQASNEEVHAAPPSVGQAWASFALLMVALVAVVGLAKVLSPSIEAALEATGAPKTVIGIVIALLVLLPETWAAVRAAHVNRLQTSFNLAYGSALASIGLTIPVVAAASVWIGMPLVLGLDAKDLVLLLLTFVVSGITLTYGRTHMMQGAVHLVIFAAFAFLALVP
jgi:Ca2+:H+ antiporter